LLTNGSKVRLLFERYEGIRKGGKGVVRICGTFVSVILNLPLGTPEDLT